MEGIDNILKNLDELIEQLHQAKDLGGYVDADRLWFRLNNLITELKGEIENLLNHPLENQVEMSNLIREQIEHYAKESKTSARKLLHSAIMHTIRNNSVPDFDDDHACSCQIEGVDGDFHCEYYIGCKTRDNLDCLKCPIYSEYLFRPENLPEWIVDGVCKKFEINPKATCNIGYACDDCPFFPNGKKEVD